MITTIRDEEETVTEEVLRFCPDATRWAASTMEWGNGYFLHHDVTVTTPAGAVTIDLHNTVAEDALSELSGLLGGVGQDTVHTVTIAENWTPAPPAPHVITVHDTHGTAMQLHVEKIDATGVIGGDLTGSSGHLHITIDGADVGSLFVHRPIPGGPITVTLGAPTPDGEGWIPAHTLPVAPLPSGARPLAGETSTQK